MKKGLIKINAILYKFGHVLKSLLQNWHCENWNRANCTYLMLVKIVEFGNLRVETEWQSESLVYLKKIIDQKQQTFSAFLFPDRLLYSNEACLTMNEINTLNINVYGEDIISQWILGVTGVLSAFIYSDTANYKTCFWIVIPCIL